jgi:tetratricopeptide (TPR) repeat protein
LRIILILAISCVFGIAAGVGVVYLNTPTEPDVTMGVGLTDLENEIIKKRGMDENQLRALIRKHAYRYNTVSGHYLAGRFAQRHHDWKAAGENLRKVMEKTGGNDPELIKRSMVLAMGAGDFQTAIDMAARVEELSIGDASARSALSALFLALEDFKNKEYAQASEKIQNMPGGSLSNFIMPLLQSWSSAALETYDVAGLNKSIVHIYHAIMIADFMKRTQDVEALLENAMVTSNLTMSDIERIADIYAHIGKKEDALKLYQQILLAVDDGDVAKKVKQLAHGDSTAVFDQVDTPEGGVAKALHDMAAVLALEYSDESARVFSHMALYLDPKLTGAKLLLARLAARNGRENEAIEAYLSITQAEGLEVYIDARRLAAGLLEDQEHMKRAIEVLNDLYTQHGDVLALIQIGDIHRGNEDFERAVKTYNKAANTFKDGVPADFWHLLYVRGMAYEQMANWKKAEKDLQAALAYQPDHPFILNYLGYAWADQGTNLEESLKLIKRALELRPTDGYITDSLGWVLYRMGRYAEAVPYLEQAVELMPYDPVINDHLGDAYWQVGRELEARFQWVRAQNHSDDEELKTTIDTKLVDGLAQGAALKTAEHETPKDAAQ